MTGFAQDIVAILTESGLRTRRERAAFVAKLRDGMGLTFSEIGKQLNVTKQRAQQLYVLNKFLQRQALGMVSYGLSEAQDEDFIEPKEFTAPADIDNAKHQISEFFNNNGFRSQFLMLPERARHFWNDPTYDFSINISELMANDWEERHPVMKEFDRLLARIGYEYDLEGEPGEGRHIFNFFRTAA